MTEVVVVQINVAHVARNNVKKINRSELWFRKQVVYVESYPAVQGENDRCRRSSNRMLEGEHVRTGGRWSLHRRRFRSRW